MKTSPSENGEYPEFCELASKDDLIFEVFRRHPAYTKIVETVSSDQGLDYIKIALNQQPKLKKYLPSFAINDTVASPKTCFFKPSLFGRKISFSPTTLRYIKTLSDLISIFGDLNQMRIIEIGGGYGGLCSIISRFFKITSYVHVDLPQSLALCKRYLDAVEIKNTSFFTHNDFPRNETYDLVISNYAFSELSGETQKFYLGNVLKKSSKGYLTCNLTTHTWDKAQMDEKEYMKHFKNLKIFKKSPPLGEIDLLCGVSLMVWTK